MLKLNHRQLEPELLDHLAVDDPSAIHSRRDLQRLNRIMGTLSIVLPYFQLTKPKSTPLIITELGAGDGSLMLRLAKQLVNDYPQVTLRMVDRQPIISQLTSAHFSQLGWHLEIITEDVFKYLNNNQSTDVLFVNLFLHHFSDEQLREILLQIAETTLQLCIACEPRRAKLPWLSSHLLGLLGCNRVTRHDAIISVKAGFHDQELSQLWITPSPWSLYERSAGLFSHVFVAQRKSNAPSKL